MCDQPAYYVYGLFDGSDPIKRIGYVGKTNNPKGRLVGHKTKIDDSKKCQWIREVYESGGTVEMIILAIAMSEQEVLRKESQLIHFYKSSGEHLANSFIPSTGTEMLDEYETDVPTTKEMEMGHRISTLEDDVVGLMESRATAEAALDLSILDKERSSILAYQHATNVILIALVLLLTMCLALAMQSSSQEEMAWMFIVLHVM